MRSLRYLFTAKVVLLALALLGAPAHAQNSICPDVATGDISNRCANTRFVNGATGLFVGTTVITGGTNPYILYNNNGVLGNESITQIGTGIKAPKLLRHVNISIPFSIAFDADATLARIVLVGAGGGGTGNGGNNFIPYSQYGDIGTPTAFDATQITVTISNATPGIVTTPSHGVAWECNRPFYFTNNGDTLPAPLAFNTLYIMYCGDNPIGVNPNAPTATTFSDVELT